MTLRHTRPLLTLGLLCASLALLATPGLSAPPSPLTDAQRGQFMGSAEDAVPKILDATKRSLRNRHYLKGDEFNLQKFYPSIKGIGGGYMGVGTDQAYLFAGWMAADFVWLTDYDPWVKWIHLSYQAFFHEADTIEAFIALWDPKQKAAAKVVIQRFHAQRDDLEKIVFVHDQGARQVHRRLRSLQRAMPRAKVPSFVSDPEMYAWVRALVKAGRVRPMLCNLLDNKGMVGIAESAKALNVPIRVLYTSNAEEYWKYKAQFRANIQALPFDEHSVVLRTRSAKAKSAKGSPYWNGDYVYNVQPGLAFKEWLKAPHIVKVRQIAPRPFLRGAKHIPLTFTKGPPPPPDAKGKKRKKKRK